MQDRRLGEGYPFSVTRLLDSELEEERREGRLIALGMDMEMVERQGPVRKLFGMLLLAPADLGLVMDVVRNSWTSKDIRGAKEKGREIQKKGS